jgi:hypothetical protein
MQLELKLKFNSGDDLIVVARVAKALDDWQTVYRLPDAASVRSAMSNALATTEALRSPSNRFAETAAECREWLENNSISTGENNDSK